MKTNTERMIRDIYDDITDLIHEYRYEALALILLAVEFGILAAFYSIGF